jgi:hypothetical protein
VPKAVVLQAVPPEVLRVRPGAEREAPVVVPRVALLAVEVVPPLALVLRPASAVSDRSLA